jgi:RNA-directed DNA polymerase
VFKDMGISKVMRQMSANAERAGVARGDAPRDPVNDETQDTTHESEGTGSAFLLEALTRLNLLNAMKREKPKTGATGIDGMDMDYSVEYLNHHWSRVRSELLAGTYRPRLARNVEILKPDGGARELGIPTVVDRLIQQALLQVLQPVIDSTFSEHSHGFRPDRRAHDAILAAQAFVQSGKKFVETPKVWRELDELMRQEPYSSSNGR